MSSITGHGLQILVPGFPTQVGWVGQHFLRCGPGGNPPALPALVAGPEQGGGDAAGAVQGGGGGGGGAGGEGQAGGA